MGATILTNITMFNLLIQIMGDTYDHTSENRQLIATKTKLEILSDYVPNIRANPTQSELKERYLYVVEPELDED